MPLEQTLKSDIREHHTSSQVFAHTVTPEQGPLQGEPPLAPSLPPATAQSRLFSSPRATVEQSSLTEAAETSPSGHEKRSQTPEQSPGVGLPC